MHDKVTTFGHDILNVQLFIYAKNMNTMKKKSMSCLTEYKNEVVRRLALFSVRAF